MALFRNHAVLYWLDKTKRLRQKLDDAEWDGEPADKIATLRQDLTNARQTYGKLSTLTNE